MGIFGPQEAAPPASSDIPDSPGTIQLTVDLPAGSTITGVSVVPTEATPQTSVSVFLETITDTPRGIHLVSGVARAVDVGLAEPQKFGVHWFGSLTLGINFSYRVKAIVRNLTGATVRWQVQVFVK